MSGGEEIVIQCLVGKKLFYMKKLFYTMSGGEETVLYNVWW